MTTHNIHHTGTPVQPYVDDYGIGQETLARIHLELAEADLAKAAPEAYSTAYIPQMWRQMRRRQVRQARAEIARAKAVLS